MADLVDEHRAADAAHVLVRSEHEVVEEQLPAPLEEIEQRRLAVRPVEDVVLVDPHPRKPAALGGERVARTGGFLLLGEERVPRCLPFRLRRRPVEDSWAPFAHSFLPISIEGDACPARSARERSPATRRPRCRGQPARLRSGREPRPARQDLLREDRNRDDRHPEEAHHAEHEQHRHQRAGTADAVEAVRETALNALPRAARCGSGAGSAASPASARRCLRRRSRRRRRTGRFVPREPADVERA